VCVCVCVCVHVCVCVDVCAHVHVCDHSTMCMCCFCAFADAACVRICTCVREGVSCSLSLSLSLCTCVCVSGFMCVHMYICETIQETRFSFCVRGGCVCVFVSARERACMCVHVSPRQGYTCFHRSSHSNSMTPSSRGRCYGLTRSSRRVLFSRSRRDMMLTR